MSQDVSAPAGWYDDGTGRQRWFDGSEWGSYADDGELVSRATPDTSPPLIVRRTRRAPFSPPVVENSDGQGVPISRSWGLGLRAATQKKNSGLTRNRKIAGDLPDWSPLPPGELSVDRKGGHHS